MRSEFLKVPVRTDMWLMILGLREIQKLAIVGYRRESKFQLNNVNTYYDHGLMKINGYDDGAVIQNEKIKEY